MVEGGWTVERPWGMSAQSSQNVLSDFLAPPLCCLMRPIQEETRRM